MDDLISRAEAIRAFAEKREVWYGNGPLPSNESLMWQAAISITEKLPAVDAVPVVHGRWQIRESGPGEIECKCSVCKYRDFVPRNDVYWVNRKFCPNCGAKMDGERRDSE